MKTNANKNNKKCFCVNKLIIKSVVFVFLFLFVPLFSLFSLSFDIFGLNSSVSAAGTTSTSTITISTAGTVDVSVTPTTSGTSATSTAKSFTVSTNNYTGYTLRITTADNTGRLNKTTSCNSTDTTRCYIPSITSASSSITTNNTWGYKPSYFNSSANTSFRPSPNSTGDIINVTSSANAANTSDSYTLQVGTKVDFGIEPGTYSRTFTITAVGNPITYDIEYIDNTGDTITGLPNSHQSGSINSGVASVDLIPYGLNDDGTNVPTRTDYTFLGWCSVPTTNNGTTCSGTTYTYNSTNQNYGAMNINETANNTALKLYATWSEDIYTIIYNGNNATAGNMSSIIHSNVHVGDEITLVASNFNKTNNAMLGWSLSSNASIPTYAQNQVITIDSSILANADSNNTIILYAVWRQADTNMNMQNFVCTSLTNIGDTIALADTRDNNVYTIRKLADGNCWMTDNLRLDIGATTITTINTNNPTNGFITAAALSSSTAPVSWCYDDNSACVDQIVYNTDNTVARSVNPVDEATNIYYYGNYYNQYAATAGNGVYGFSGDAAGDICPHGWHLPVGNTIGEWANLSYSLGGLTTFMNGNTAPTAAEMYSISHQLPTAIIDSGYVSGAIFDRGVAGFFRSSTSIGQGVAYMTQIEKVAFYPGTEIMESFNGYTIRCIANDPISYSLMFDSNGGSGAPQTQIVSSANSFYDFTIPSTIPTRDYFVFQGWVLDGTTSPVYDVGDTIRVYSQSTKLVALWESTREGFKIRHWYDVNTLVEEPYEFQYAQPFSWDSSAFTAPLKAPNMKRNGYSFAGWSGDPNVASSINSSNHSKIYGPNEVFSTSQNDLIDLADEDGNIDLYAVWLPSSGSLQQFSCNSLSVGEVTSLTDIRDDNVYSVAKLSDNNCWMIENMRLDFSNMVNGVSITSDNTDNPSSAFVTAVTSAQPISASSFCVTKSSSCINRINYDIENLNYLSSTDFSYGVPRYEYGVYYNWYTATAGNGTYAISSSSVNGSICPQGWRLPTGSSSGETSIMARSAQDDSSNVGAFPYNFVISGFVYNTNGTPVLNRESVGWVQSSTALDTSASYDLYLYSSANAIQVSYNNQSYKYRGRSIRCIANTPVTYALLYDAGEDATNIPESQTITNGNTFHDFIIPNSTPTRANYSFDGWATSSSATSPDYSPGDTIRVTSAITTLYAVWSQ